MRNKINMTEACNFLAEKMGVKEVAEFYQVTENAIYTAKGRLKQLVCQCADKNMTKQQIMRKYGITESCFLMLIGTNPYKNDGDVGAAPDIIPSSADGTHTEKQCWRMPYAPKTKLVQVTFDPEDVMGYINGDKPYWVIEFAVTEDDPFAVKYDNVIVPKLIPLSSLTLKELNRYTKSPTAVIFTTEKAF